MTIDKAPADEAVRPVPITRKSMISGKVHTLELPVTEQQLQAYERGSLLQDAFPQLTPPQREFIKTGITPEEWQTQVIGEAGSISSADVIPIHYPCHLCKTAPVCCGKTKPDGTCCDSPNEEPVCSSRCQMERDDAAPSVPKKLPPDPEGGNDVRAEWAACSIRHFQCQTGTDWEDAPADLLCDLMHFCDRAGFDFEHELVRARMHYEAETDPCIEPEETAASAANNK